MAEWTKPEYFVPSGVGVLGVRKNYTRGERESVFLYCGDVLKGLKTKETEVKAEAMRTYVIRYLLVLH